MMMVNGFLTRFLVTGQPELSQIQVIGTGVQEVAFLDGAGSQTMRVRPGKGQRRVRLENVFLLPGEHSVSVAVREAAATPCWPCHSGVRTRTASTSPTTTTRGSNACAWDRRGPACWPTATIGTTTASTWPPGITST